MRDGFIKVAAGTPQIRVADCRYNAEQIFTLMREADKQGVRVLALPELCLTGYTCGDLFLQDTLLRGAEEGLATILEATKHLDLLAAVGLPVRHQNKLYNCAAVLHRGEILALVPKTYLPNYGEFYEKRWFEPAGPGDRLFSFCGQEVYLGSDVIFPCESMPGLTVGVEICEDLWASTPPSVALAEAGATVILNLSASDELVGKAEYRRRLVCGQSARLVCGYVYANAGEGESTTDLVFNGHNIVAENGALLAERRFATGLTVSEVDVERLDYERRRLTTFRSNADSRVITVPFALEPCTTTLTRHVNPLPFVPEDGAECSEHCDEIILLAALGLKKRMEHSGAQAAVVGLSGGLDSTLAILITSVAMRLMDRPASDMIAVTMPCFGTTERTRDNAVELAERLGATLRRIDIGAAVRQHFKDIGQSMDDHDVTFENSQAHHPHPPCQPPALRPGGRRRVQRTLRRDHPPGGAGPQKAHGAQRRTGGGGGPVRRAGLHPGHPHHQRGHAPDGPAGQRHDCRYHALLRHHRAHPGQRRGAGRAAGGHPQAHRHRRGGSTALQGHWPVHGRP